MDEQNNVALQSDPRTRPMTFGDWMKTLLLLMIPGVNFVLMIIWAFSEDVNISKKNYFRAYIVLSIIIIVVILLFQLLLLILGGAIGMYQK